jgi:hypothetical protein
MPYNPCWVRCQLGQLHQLDSVDVILTVKSAWVTLELSWLVGFPGKNKARQPECANLLIPSQKGSGVVILATMSDCYMLAFDDATWATKSTRQCGCCPESKASMRDTGTILTGWLSRKEISKLIRLWLLAHTKSVGLCDCHLSDNISWYMLGHNSRLAFRDENRAGQSECLQEVRWTL